jgi:hypothetical protein
MTLSAQFEEPHQQGQYGATEPTRTGGPKLKVPQVGQQSVTTMLDSIHYIVSHDILRRNSGARDAADRAAGFNPSEAALPSADSWWVAASTRR